MKYPKHVRIKFDNEVEFNDFCGKWDKYLFEEKNELNTFSFDTSGIGWDTVGLVYYGDSRNVVRLTGSYPWRVPENERLILSYEEFDRMYNLTNIRIEVTEEEYKQLRNQVDSFTPFNKNYSWTNIWKYIRWNSFLKEWELTSNVYLGCRVVSLTDFCTERGIELDFTKEPAGKVEHEDDILDESKPIKYSVLVAELKYRPSTEIEVPLKMQEADTPQFISTDDEDVPMFNSPNPKLQSPSVSFDAEDLPF